jgi:uncharacterized protein
MSVAERIAGGASPAGKGAVTIVTQTRVRPECAGAFAQWQDETSAIVGKFRGFVDQKVIPPTPPAQDDWVIVQRFTSTEAALAWLHSEQRLKRVEQIAPMLVGRDDVHIVTDDEAGVLPAPVSAVISTRIKLGQEDAYRAWERRIATAQSRAPGFQGYRFEPPIPGVQDDWLAIVRFDSEANLQAWLDSPERHKLLEEAEEFTQEFNARIVRTGFDQWFKAPDGAPPPAAWKMNMLVLLMLYPVVFLFGAWVQTPLLMGKAGLPFWLALFVGNVVGVLLLNWLVPAVSRGFGWWLAPARGAGGRTSFAGAMLVLVLYGLWLFLFSQL